MKKIPLIIDCDPGVDDAIALIVANAKEVFDIKAVTSVAGNVELEYTTHNMQILANLLDLKCPIAKGEDRPLVKKQVTAGKTHGSDGFGGYAHLLKDVGTRQLHHLSAVKLMASILKESEEPVVIVAVGPLTNIALLVKAYPELLPKIEKFSIMGGGLIYGNTTSTAEFNFYVDPEAAQIVFNSGVPIILAALDATFQARVQPEDFATFKQIDNEVANIATKILASYASKDTALHDPVSILILSNPEIFETEEMYIQIETNEGSTRAMSYADNRDRNPHPNNTTFITKIDRDKFFEEVKKTFEYYHQ